MGIKRSKVDRNSMRYFLGFPLSRKKQVLQDSKNGFQRRALRRDFPTAESGMVEERMDVIVCAIFSCT